MLFESWQANYSCAKKNEAELQKKIFVTSHLFQQRWEQKSLKV